MQWELQKHLYSKFLIQYLKSSNIQYFWTKTEARLYQTPVELVSMGYAASSKERISKDESAKGRERTVYTITDQGHSALRAWLGQPAQPPRFEIEGLLKLAYGEQGTRSNFTDRIAEMQRAIVRSGSRDGLCPVVEAPRLSSRLHLSIRMADLTDRVRWVVLDWLAEVRTDAENWETIESTPERVEQAKARYRAVAEQRHG